MSRGHGRSLVQPPVQSRASQGFRPGYSGIWLGGLWNPPVEEMVYLGSTAGLCWENFSLNSGQIFLFSPFPCFLSSLFHPPGKSVAVGTPALLLDPSELPLNHNKQAHSSQRASAPALTSMSDLHCPCSTLSMSFLFWGREGRSGPSVIRVWSLMSTYWRMLSLSHIFSIQQAAL